MKNVLGNFSFVDYSASLDKWKKYFMENNIKIDDLNAEIGNDSENGESLNDISSTLSESCSNSPFVRAPLEDRSKYEKLTSNLDDVSSDDSTNGECFQLNHYFHY